MSALVRGEDVATNERCYLGCVGKDGLHRRATVIEDLTGSASSMRPLCARDYLDMLRYLDGVKKRKRQVVASATV